MFKGRKGKALAVEMGGNKVRTFVPGAQVPATAASQTATPQRPKHDMDAIKVIDIIIVTGDCVVIPSILAVNV